jgi:hypothetical protein
MTELGPLPHAFDMTTEAVESLSHPAGQRLSLPTGRMLRRWEASTVRAVQIW